MVTLGATCLYWLTSSWSAPPCVPGSVPFMPCQKVMVTGAALAAGLATAVAAPAAAAATVGAAWATAVAAGLAAAATVGATACTVGATAATVALTTVAAGAAWVGAAAGDGLEQAASTRAANSGNALRTLMRAEPPSAFQAASRDAFQEMAL